MEDNLRKFWEGLTRMSESNPDAYQKFIEKQMNSYKEEEENRKKYTFTPEKAPLTVLTTITRADRTPYTPTNEYFKVQEVGVENVVLDVLSIHFTGHEEVGLPQYKTKPGTIAPVNAPMSLLIVPLSVGTITRPPPAKKRVRQHQMQALAQKQREILQRKQAEASGKVEADVGSSCARLDVSADAEWAAALAELKSSEDSEVQTLLAALRQEQGDGRAETQYAGEAGGLYEYVGEAEEDAEVAKYVKKQVAAARRNCGWRAGGSVSVNVAVRRQCVDVVFHPALLQRARSDLECRLALVQLALVYCEEDNAVACSRSYSIVERMVDVGLRQVMYTKEGLAAASSSSGGAAQREEDEVDALARALEESLASVTAPTGDVVLPSRAEEAEESFDIVLPSAGTAPAKPAGKQAVAVMSEEVAVAPSVDGGVDGDGGRAKESALGQGLLWELGVRGQGVGEELSVVRAKRTNDTPAPQRSPTPLVAILAEPTLEQASAPRACLISVVDPTTTAPASTPTVTSVPPAAPNVVTAAQNTVLRDAADREVLSYALERGGGECRVTFTMPLEDSAAAVDVEILPQAVLVSSRHYVGKALLPVSVDVDMARAKWSKKKHALTISAPEV